MTRLDRKFETARTMVPGPEIHTMKGARVAILAFGSTDPAIQEARDRLADLGVPSDYLRLRALPISDEVLDFLRNHERVYVVEMNRDGQLRQILSTEITGCETTLVSLAHNDGLALTAAWIQAAIMVEEALTHE
jgi:2-oxoglutarate ferredoxin oxidoreductase subunit alpha